MAKAKTPQIDYDKIIEILQANVEKLTEEQEQVLKRLNLIALSLENLVKEIDHKRSVGEQKEPPV